MSTGVTGGEAGGADGGRGSAPRAGTLAPAATGGVRGDSRAARFLPRTGEWRLALRRTPVSVWNDDVTDWAAALTYYAVLAIFPALLVTVSAVGLGGTDATHELIARVTTVLPAESGELMAGLLKDMAAQSKAAWLLAVFGTAGSLWSASSYLSVFRRALHAMHRVEDHRPVWRTVPRIVLTALVLLTLLVSSVFVLMLSGEVARTAGGLLGMDDFAAGAWNTTKWPLLVGLVAVLVLVVFRTGPAGTRGVRKRAPGGALAVLLWLVASLGFALYASHFGTYHRLYGSLAGIVVFLVWLWMSNLALLAGAQFNAELAKLRRGADS
ncbi:YihY/virulence factor BrkB family protein [Streptomyces sp. WMMB 322]|uniref:YihY/virulence factor BrkB family protein n=1 Tax=Streptomyces sp. WMMB 322 TaxID=1286821 RepID=UPI0008237CEA|nr:YihY/virulence factor BrkB family protein [Streptomyces sp. WMMB 322]SCK29436.1 membrane protein [Streptomyces sp. WMMB 322]